MPKDIRVTDWGNHVTIYDRYGSGHVTVPNNQVAHVINELMDIKDEQ
jgi:hypothetical protein